MILLISESSFGKHHKIENPNIKLLSTKGSSIVNFRPNGYKVSEKFLEKIKSHKPSFVLIGTDLDLQGTKIATLLHHSLNSLGIKNFRFALTEKGYMRIGSFFDLSRLKIIHRMERANIEFAKKMKRNLGISIGRKTFLLLGAIQHFKKTKPIVKNLNSNGSNTFTAITKVLLQNKSMASAVMELQSLYYREKIPYPRVDNDYIQDKPYDLYPHPNLREYGYKADIVIPLAKNSYPFGYKTLWLHLNNERLITPSTVLYYDNQLNKFFWNKETLNPFKQYRDLLDFAEDFFLESREDYKRELTAVYYPQLRLSEPKPISTLKNKKEYELLELFEEMEQTLYRREEENINLEEQQKIWQRYRQIETAFSKEIEKQKGKFKGLSP